MTTVGRIDDSKWIITKNENSLEKNMFFLIAKLVKSKKKYMVYILDRLMTKFRNHVSQKEDRFLFRLFVCDFTSREILWNCVKKSKIRRKVMRKNSKLKFFLEKSLIILVTQLSYGSPCNITDHNVYYNQSCPTNLTCAQFGDSAAYCTCLANYFYSTYCIPKYLNGVACTSNTQCRTDLGLYCNTSSGYNYCMCNITSYWYATTGVCLYKLSNSTACVTSSQCQDYLGLSCISAKCRLY
jgi:hypothetical protein